MSHHTEDTAVIIPWRPSPSRIEAANYAGWWWRREWGLHPFYGTDSHDGEPFRKGALIANGIRIALAENPKIQAFVIADADVVMDHASADMAEAIEVVRSPRHPARWSVPHLDVHRHGEAWTAEQLKGETRPHASTVLLPDLAPTVHRGHPGGGLLVLSREIADARCLPDPRFAGWGQEDDSWAFALRTLYGAPWRGSSPLHHLWHVPEPRISRAVGSVSGQGLYRRYLGARLNRARMGALVAEGWTWWDDRERRIEGSGV
jgi:hypothetical protein